MPGITSGFTTFLSAGGCYPSEPVYNISISRAAPAPDAGATPLIIGTLSFPKASFPAGVVVTLRPNTSQPCASRESFWSSPANLPARQLLGGNAIALPLKLLSFTATEKDCAAKLQWETDDEQNASYFEIEQSTDAVQYKSIGKVSALGNGGGKKYQTSVPQFSTSAFYRLKMVDIDGAYKYSNVLNLKQNCLSKAGVTIRVYPNPASRNEPVTVDITTPQTGAGLLQFFAADGRIVLSRPINFTSEFNRILLPTGSLVKGTYLLKLTGTNGEKIANVQKVVIY
ncbi:MAG: T9SS type A sorting domain-containing protein [Bacteroidetes bacterium]|nr:T9SS type A sorting domain-containing protein [Bacteroidota bacterium]